MQRKDPLGKGLSAILKDIEEKGASRLVPVGEIIPGKSQPRFEIKEDALAELTKLDHELQIKNEQLKSLKKHEQIPDKLNKQRVLIEEINMIIDQFHAVRQGAQLKYYYLIVTREALGLRRHDMIQEIYRIPVKKKKIQAF